MEINKKARGQKHHYNKQRYQNKAKIVSKVASEKKSLGKNRDIPKETSESEKGLTSNWHRYEELPEENAVDESTNFSLLVQAPISHGGHFQFKSDKNIESEFDFESLRNNKMFSLDLHLLQSSLSTIPFHERCGLDENYFTEGQLEEIYQRAHQNTVQYESYQRISLITKDFAVQSVSSKENSKCEEQHSLKTVSSDRKSKLDVIEDIEVVKGSQDCQREVQRTKTSNVQGGEKQEDLEQWLDDILND